MIVNRRRFLTAAARVTTGALGLTLSDTRQLNGDDLRLPVEGLPVKGQIPSLQGAVGWLNSEPLTDSDLHGKVVLINFWTYTCINSLRTLPYLRAWVEKYQRQGLVVIGVHTPEFTFEHDITNVRVAAKKVHVDYPIAVDSDYAIWRAFENQYWPAFYLADQNGRIRHHQFGEGAYEGMESAIQQLLRKAGRGNVSHALVPARGYGIEAAPDWASLQSPESYVGAALAQNFASKRWGRSYQIPSQLKLDHWALEGDWKVGQEAAILNGADGRVAYRFHARDLHMVMAAPPGASVRFRVSLNGQPPGLAHGLDVDGEGYGTLSEPRLYQLIRQPNSITDRQFQIEFMAPGAQVLDFTFG